MTRKPVRVSDVERALALLCQARDLLRRAQAPRTLARTRLAISSAKGALRNQWHRAYLEP